MGGRIAIVVANVGRDFRITVSDDGTGMSEAQRARVFEPFFTTKEAGKGTGLGLSISHGIIEDHGGRIEIDSREGHGTTVKIHLPVQSPDQSTSDATEITGTRPSEV